MRILHVLEAVEGGAALHVRTLTVAQRALGYEVAVVAPRRRSSGVTDADFWRTVGSVDITAQRMALHHLPFHPRNMVAARQLAEFMRKWTPDIVHSHSTAAGAIARVISRRLGLTAVHTPNGVRFADVKKTAAAVGELFVERLLARSTSRVVAVSESEADVLGAAYEKSKIAVVPNGIAPSDEPAEPLPERPRVVSVARFKYQKAPELTVRILAELRRRRPEVQATIVGDGERASHVRRLRNKLDPDIQLQLGGAGGREAIKSSTVVLLTSRWEGGPYALMEAMERSRPVVATDVVGSRDVVSHARTGYLTPFGDVNAAVCRLIELVDHRELACQMGRLGRERLLDRYTLNQMVSKLSAVYTDATGR